jgi:hypothetical protein
LFSFLLNRAPMPEGARKKMTTRGSLTGVSPNFCHPLVFFHFPAVPSVLLALSFASGRKPQWRKYLFRFVCTRRRSMLSLPQLFQGPFAGYFCETWASCLSRKSLFCFSGIPFATSSAGCLRAMENRVSGCGLPRYSFKTGCKR